jgi:hypothetical protein
MVDREGVVGFWSRRFSDTSFLYPIFGSFLIDLYSSRSSRTVIDLGRPDRGRDSRVRCLFHLFIVFCTVEAEHMRSGTPLPVHAEWHPLHASK